MCCFYGEGPQLSEIARAVLGKGPRFSLLPVKESLEMVTRDMLPGGEDNLRLDGATKRATAYIQIVLHRVTSPEFTSRIPEGQKGLKVSLAS